MLKSCSYCGGIHDRKYICDKKPAKNKKVTRVDKFRWTQAWQNKRKYIREDRDRHLCQVCIRVLHNTQQRYNFRDIQVHHIIPITEGSEGWSKRLDDSNLIALCSYHHSLAEHGNISRKELLEIVEEQESQNSI